jgi:multicomponent Na+:H+ antiporter subunit C
MTGDLSLARYPYVFIAVLVVIGVWGMVMKRNLLKKVVGMGIFQGAIYLLLVHGANKAGGAIPIHSAKLGLEPDAYMNPLPHVLVLTAIVVGVAIMGVALSLLVVIHRRFGTLDEARILEKLREQG